VGCAISKAQPIIQWISNGDALQFARECPELAQHFSLHLLGIAADKQPFQPISAAWLFACSGLVRASPGKLPYPTSSDGFQLFPRCSI
jgi:hypothetical protein